MMYGETFYRRQSRDGVLILVLTQVLFSVLSYTLYLAKFMSMCTRTYLSTEAKTSILISTLRVLLSTFLSLKIKLQSDVQIFRKSVVSLTGFILGQCGHIVFLSV